MKNKYFNLTKMIFVVSLALFLVSNTTTAIIPETMTHTKEQIIQTIPIDSYDITSSENEDIVTIPDYGWLLIPGKPQLPSRIFSIAVPPGATIHDVTFQYPEPITLPGTYQLPPVPITQVIGQEDPQLYQRDLAIYNTNYQQTYLSPEAYPQENAEYLQTAGYREYNLVDIRFTPFTYYPLTEQLSYYPSLTIVIDYSYEKKGIQTPSLSQNAYAQELAEKIVYNHNQTQEWYTTTAPRETYDYVIITTDALVDNIDALVEWEEGKGHQVQIKTTSSIANEYDGYDLQEKMRNFLREKYPQDQWGIQYVCLIGHYDDVPMRRTAQNTGYGQPETDFYYAELSLPDDESWDKDGDHQYGENNDPIDYYAEVVVGRIPWSNDQIVEDICEKTVAYEQKVDPSFKKNILLLGAFFWSDTDNAVLMETKVDQPWMEDWTMTRMYEQGHSSYPMDYNLEYDNVQTVWSEGTFAFVNWAGHGSPTACYEYYPSQAFTDTTMCNQLNDDYPAIIFADACSNSDTDHLNIGQAMLKQGGVGFLGATKVAYGKHAWNNPYSGSSQSFDYFFTTCCTSGEYTQGEAHQWSLVEMYTHGLWYYQKYETFEWGALWGNPDLQMGLVNPAPDIPAKPNGPGQGVNQVTYSFTAVTTDPDNEELYYQFDWGNGNTSSWIGPLPSGQTAEGTYAWKTPGAYEVTVRAKDEVGAQSPWSEPHPISIIEGPILDVGPISGGLLKVNGLIRNRGTADATNVNYTITLEGGTILLGRETKGQLDIIAGGETGVIQSDPIIGFGKTLIRIDAEIPRGTDYREQSGTAFLFYVYIVPGGG